MNPSDEKIIELSKKKIFLALIGSCVFVLIGAAFLLVDDQAIRSLRRFNSPAVFHGIGVLAVLVFGVFGVLLVRKMFSRQAGLVLNSAGILDHYNGMTVAWSDITAIEQINVFSTKMIAIKVRDPQKQIEQGGALKRLALKSNHRLYGTPNLIASSPLRISFGDLFALLTAYKDKYAQPTEPPSPSPAFFQPSGQPSIKY